MSEKFIFGLYTAQQLSDIRTLRILWQLLDVPLVSPKRYDSVERARNPFGTDSVESAVQIYQDHGMLFVRGGKDGFLGFLSSEREDLSIWRFYLSIVAMQGRKAKRWLNWIFNLCNHLPVLYGYGCSIAEHDAKHTYVKNLPGGGRVTGAIGISVSEFYQYLPGLYWLTIFGPELVRAFGQSKLMAMPGVEAFLLDSQQIAISLNEPVLAENMDQRLKTESGVADVLGAQFFFDRNRSDLKFELVPQLARVLKSSIREDASKSKDGAETFSSPVTETSEDDFENQVILSPDGTPYADPHDLAEMLAVYLHTNVQEVFAYSRSALEALDAYFVKHPQQREYTNDHLTKQFIPALGAYLGEVLVRELKGKWVVREPLLQSVIMIQGKEIPVFRLAFQCIYKSARLLDAYV